MSVKLTQYCGLMISLITVSVEQSAINGNILLCR
ncbi:hypothetical protein PE36_00559 [Moritella sp. PE36]|nr:hypothetical protein PE36_00559 [Moritella sp. PE36]